jgi:SAM-dependent methyltransferase
LVIGDLSPPNRLDPRRNSADAIAWEGVVVDPDGLVEQAIWRRGSIEEGVVLEIGPSSLIHAIRHADRASQVYAAKFDDGRLYARTPQPLGLPGNVNLIRCDADGLPLRDGIVSLAILREPFPGTPQSTSELALPEALRVLKVGGHLVVVSLNYLEGDLGALLEAMIRPEDGSEMQLAKVRFWKGMDFQPEQVATRWRAPGRTILRRVLAAEFAGLPGAKMAGEVAVSELSCAFDLFWKQK